MYPRIVTSTTKTLPRTMVMAATKTKPTKRSFHVTAEALHLRQQNVTQMVVGGTVGVVAVGYAIAQHGDNLESIERLFVFENKFTLSERRTNSKG